MKTNILIADDNVQFTETLKAELMQDPSFSVVAVAPDGKQAIRAFETLRPDVVVLDLVMPETDGFGFLQAIDKGKAKIVVLSALSRDEFVEKAVSLGADYYMRKPCSYPQLLSRIAELAGGESAHVRPKKTEMDEKISNIFITVGIPAHIKGYQFLREAIKMAVENPDIINSITKRLYPEVARKFDTSPSKVERAIRHAIEVAWNRGRIEALDEAFGKNVCSLDDKPTNGEFIALVADRLSMKESA